MVPGDEGFSETELVRAARWGYMHWREILKNNYASDDLDAWFSQW